MNQHKIIMRHIEKKARVDSDQTENILHGGKKSFRGSLLIQFLASYVFIPKPHYCCHCLWKYCIAVTCWNRNRILVNNNCYFVKFRLGNKTSYYEFIIIIQLESNGSIDQKRNTDLQATKMWKTVNLWLCESVVLKTNESQACDTLK